MLIHFLFFLFFNSDFSFEGFCELLIYRYQAVNPCLQNAIVFPQSLHFYCQGTHSFGEIFWGFLVVVVVALLQGGAWELRVVGEGHDSRGHAFQ